MLSTIANRMCGNKSQLSETNAWATARKLRKKGDACHAYHCKRCGYWHIGEDRRMSNEFVGGAEG